MIECSACRAETKTILFYFLSINFRYKITDFYLLWQKDFIKPKIRFYVCTADMEGMPPRAAIQCDRSWWKINRKSRERERWNKQKYCARFTMDYHFAYEPKNGITLLCPISSEAQRKTWSHRHNDVDRDRTTE